MIENNPHVARAMRSRDILSEELLMAVRPPMRSARQYSRFVRSTRTRARSRTNALPDRDRGSARKVYAPSAMRDERRTSRALALAAVVCLLAGVVRADKVWLKDGKSLTGRVVYEDATKL